MGSVDIQLYSNFDHAVFDFDSLRDLADWQQRHVFWAFRDDLQRLNQVDHLSSHVAVLTLEGHEVARHESAQLQIAPVVS